MNNSKSGLKVKDEEDILDKSKTREIVQVILTHGINQNQMYHMIYLLALELENQDNTKKITKLINQLTTTVKTKSPLITGE
jgi:hypothetical protein|tara:strand:- start:152 stop:394 length:243 start_codon:yes stop_codon:yes gene_type:complete